MYKEEEGGVEESEEAEEGRLGLVNGGGDGGGCWIVCHCWRFEMRFDFFFFPTVSKISVGFFSVSWAWV